MLQKIVQINVLTRNEHITGIITDYNLKDNSCRAMYTFMKLIHMTNKKNYPNKLLFLKYHFFVIKWGTQKAGWSSRRLYLKKKSFKYRA
jgi:hypothetical protein